MGNFTLGNINFNYGIQRGTVIEIDEKFETIVSGTGGGYVANDHGRSSVNVSSRTVKHTSVYLQDESGKQFNVKLVDWEIACIPTHELLFIWVSNERLNSYTIIYNKTLDEVYRLNNFEDYFFRDEKAGLFFGCLISGAMLVFIPCAAYMAFLGGKYYDQEKGYLVNDDGTANIAAALAFVIVLVGLILFFIKKSNKRKSQETLAKKLVDKVFEILNKNR